MKNLSTYKIEVATELSDLDKEIIKEELIARLERILEILIDEKAQDSRDDFDKIVDDVEEDFKYNLLDADQFDTLQEDHELINVFQSDEPESWDYQKSLINNWAKN